MNDPREQLVTNKTLKQGKERIDWQTNERSIETSENNELLERRNQRRKSCQELTSNSA